MSSSMRCVLKACLDVMCERLLYAIAHCSEVDADGGIARTGNYRVEEDDDDDEQQHAAYF